VIDIIMKAKRFHPPTNDYNLHNIIVVDE